MDLFTIARVCPAFLLAFIVSGSRDSLAATAPSRPNILLIVADDLGYGDLGFTGCKDIPTPHLDALAASGIRFTDGYVSGAYCSPTRAGLMTGRYQQRFGYEYNPKVKAHGLPASETTLAQRLKAAGYVTGLVGKWNLGEVAEHHPQIRGFDEFFGFLSGGHNYFNSKSILRGTEPVKEKEYLTDAFAREAEAFIASHQDKPWFLFLSFNAVHTPLEADPPRLAKFAHIADKARGKYAAMTSAMDDAVGRVLRKVSGAGLQNNTLVFFFSDNGGPTVAGTAANSSRNFPFRGGKRTTLEGGVRVPFVISWPGRLTPGVSRQRVIQLDVFPTALALAGVDIKPEWNLDGTNLMPFLTDSRQGQPHETLYWRLGPQMAVRSGDYKLVRYDDVVDTGADVGRRSRATPFKVTPPKLYRLSDDAGETIDLSASMPGKVRELQSLWDRWSATLVEPKWSDARINGKNAKKAP